MELSCTSDNWEKRKPEKPPSTFCSINTMKPMKGLRKKQVDFLLIGHTDLLVSVWHTNYGSSQIISGFDTRKHSGRGMGVGKLQSSHLEKCWLKNMFNSISSFVKTHLVAGEKPECKCQQWETTVHTTQDLQHPLLDLLQPKTEAWSQVNIPPHKRLSQASGRGQDRTCKSCLSPEAPSSTSPKSPAPKLSVANPWLIRPTRKVLSEIFEPSDSSTLSQAC